MPEPIKEEEIPTLTRPLRKMVLLISSEIPSHTAIGVLSFLRVRCLQGDVVLRDIVDPGQEIRIREVVGIEDDDLIDSPLQVFQGVGDGLMFHAMLEIRREELDRELGERLVRFLPHMVRYHDHPVFVRRIVLQEDALHGFLYDLVFLIGGEDDGELLEPYAPVLPVPPPKKGRQRKK